MLQKPSIFDIVTNISTVISKISCKELEEKADEIIKDIKKL